MKKSIFLFVFVGVLVANSARSQVANQVPTISNLEAQVDWAAQSLQLTFDLSDAENDVLEVQIELSSDGGATYAHTSTVTWQGDVGAGISAGAGKSATANVAALAQVPTSQFRARVTVLDGQMLDIQALVDQVDSVRLKNNLEFVEGIRHRTAGGAHLAATRDSIFRAFEALGIHAGTQTFAFGNYTATNVIGTHSGTHNADNVVIADAHYDSVSNAPGADDNGSGVVGFLEIARVLSPFPNKKTIRYIGFDLEEAGLLGSIRYVSSGLSSTDSVDGVFNFEMIGYYSEEPNSQTLPAGFNLLFQAAYDSVANNQFRGDFITNVGNANSATLVNLFNASAATYVPDLRVIGVVVPGNGSIAPDLRRSDHAPFWEANKPALMLTDGANFRNDNYHMASDTAGVLNFTFMRQVVQATLASMVDLADVQHGAWSTVDFSGTSSVQDPLSGCALTLRAVEQGHQLWLESPTCNLTSVGLQVIDAAGRQVYAQQRTHLPSGSHFFELPTLAQGTYFARINANGGQRSLSFVIR
jgi:hypothetical protein